MKYAEDIFYAFNENIIKYLPLDKPAEKIEDTKDFISQRISNYKKGEDLVWHIIFKNQFTGLCGIHGIKSRTPHFGLWIKEKQQGKGIGKAVVNFALKYVLKNIDFDYVKYQTDIRNFGSIVIIEKITTKVYDKYPLGINDKLNIAEYRLYKNQKYNFEL